jgi:hypothetical protein
MTATTYTVLDSAGNTKTFQAEDVGATGQLSSKVTVRESALPTGAATEATLLLVEGAVDGIEALLSGTLAVSAVSLPLPTGAATEATLAAVETAVDGIEALLGGTLTVSGTVAATQSGTWNITNVSGTVSLPTGAATETTLATLSTEATLLLVESAVDGIKALLGGTLAVSAASLPLPTGASTAAKQPALGTAGTASTDVLTVQGIASMTALTVDGSAVTQPVSASSLPLPTGAATEVTLAAIKTAVETIDNAVSGSGVNISRINGVTPLMGTGNTGTGALRVDLTANGTGQVAAVGKANHDAAVSGAPVLNGGYASAAAPANVSANGDVVRAWHLLNGAQATVLTAAGALIGGDATDGLDVDVTRLPALPAGTNNIGDVDVVSLPVATSGGAANVTSSATNVTLLASNASRKGFTIFNDSTSVLYVKFGATASATSFHVKMAAGSYYESPAGVNYTGIIDGIWASANGNARVGEFT